MCRSARNDTPETRVSMFLTTSVQEFKFYGGFYHKLGSHFVTLHFDFWSHMQTTDRSGLDEVLKIEPDRDIQFSISVSPFV